MRGILHLSGTFLVLLFVSFPALHATEVTDRMLKELALTAPQAFSAASGEKTWMREVDGRSCTSCHTDSVFVRGRHERTGKVIEPMAPSINAERLNDAKKINKWLFRNCKWTLGRECTAQEKGDVLLWLSQQ